MNIFLYAMTESFEKMKNEIDSILKASIYTEEEKNRIFLSVGSCLHSILDYAERVDVDESDKRFVSAFRYANNSLKHDITVLKITEHEGGIEFSISFPLEIPERQIVWEIFSDGGLESQKKNYLRFLKGKDVIGTCGEIINILKKYDLGN